MSLNYTKQSKIFQNFRAIPYSDYYYLIRYYEQHHKEIDCLPIEEDMIMSFYYINALFLTEDYQNLISYANQLLENSILYNIDFIDGTDIYTTVLYQKTYAHLQLNDTAKATNLAKQLVGIDYRQSQHIQLLRQCYIVLRPTWIHPTLITSAFATLMAAIAIIFMAAFHNYTTENAMIIPYSLLAFAGIGLIATAVGYYYAIEYPLKKVLKRTKSKNKF